MAVIKGAKARAKYIESLKQQLQEQKEVTARLRARLSKTFSLSQQRYKELVDLKYTLRHKP